MNLGMNLEMISEIIFKLVSEVTLPSICIPEEIIFFKSNTTGILLMVLILE